MTFDLPYGPNISWQEQADTLQIQRSGNLLEFAMQNDRFFFTKANDLSLNMGHLYHTKVLEGI